MSKEKLIGQDKEESVELTNSIAKENIQTSLEKEPKPESSSTPSQSMEDSSLSPSKENKPTDSSKPIDEKPMDEKPKPEIKRMLPTRAIVPKGLPNLGNTCFYNSAIQCLLSTHHLAFYHEKAAKEFSFTVPDCTVTVYDKKIELESAEIPVTFEKYTAFIKAFKNFLTEFYSERSPNPRTVFEQVAQRAPRFRGWHQQDSHELLRYLIDGLRQEEIDAIGHSVKKYLAEKQETDEPDRRKRACMNFAKPVLDCVFGGSLLQIICCSECNYESVCFEPFLDLSLSIPRNTQHVQQHQPKLNPFMSKNQQKKAAKKNKKKKNKKKKNDKNNWGSGKDKQVEKEEDEKMETGTNADEFEEGEINDDDDFSEKQSNGDMMLTEEKEEFDDENSDIVSNTSNDTTTDATDFKAKIECAKPLVTLQIPEGKTVEHALARFTVQEQLRGSNSYECENCCAPINKKEGKRHKTVSAQKKYLLYSLPPVLTLHLKRFEKSHNFNRTYTTKINDHVDFPMILDVAPYCSKATEEVSKGQNKILYSLYGIVCHSGSLSGGHYIAFVKSRKPSEHIEKFFKQASFIDASSLGDFIEYQKIDSEDIFKKHLNIESMNEEEARAAVSSGSWYYCSDSHVAPVSEDRVRSAEAYLLFYERFY